MGQGTCGRMAAALTISLLGLSPAFAMDWVEPTANADPNSGGVLFARPCPTRFDYLVLASFADAPSLLSLALAAGARCSGRWIRADQGEVPRAVLVPDDVSAAGHHDGGAGEQARGR